MHQLMPMLKPTQVIIDFEESHAAAVCAVFGGDVVVFRLVIFRADLWSNAYENPNNRSPSTVSSASASP